jgi:hypothetical protein
MEDVRSGRARAIEAVKLVTPPPLNCAYGFMTYGTVGGRLEAGAVADVVDFAYRGTGSEAQPPRRSADWAGLAGGGLIGVGIALWLLYTFLVYQPALDGVAQVSFLLVAALDTGVLAASAGLVVAGSWPTTAPAWPDPRARRRVCGGLLGASLCALYLMTSLGALANVIAGLGHYGPYPLLSQAWWLPVAAGSGLALVRKGGLASMGRPGRPHRGDTLPLALLAVTVFGAFATWVPPWDKFTFTGSMGPHSEQLVNDFAAPGVAIAGSVAIMAVIAALAAAAALWRPARPGAVLLTGAVVYFASFAIAGICSVIEVPTRASFGITDPRMTVSVAGTPWLWAYCGCTAALIIVYEWLFTRSRPHHRKSPLR